MQICIAWNSRHSLIHINIQHYLVGKIRKQNMYEFMLDVLLHRDFVNIPKLKLTAYTEIRMIK